MTYLTKSFEKRDFHRMLALLNFWKNFIKFTGVLRDPIFSTFATNWVNIFAANWVNMFVKLGQWPNVCA